MILVVLKLDVTGHLGGRAFRPASMSDWAGARVGTRLFCWGCDNNAVLNCCILVQRSESIYTFECTVIVGRFKLKTKDKNRLKLKHPRS